MFISKARHAAVVAILNARNDGLAVRVESIAEERNDAISERRTIGRALAEKVAECAALEAELAPLKAARERANANLAAANARRKVGALPASVKGEGL